VTAERILFVHAHPDDESIVTGGTIATLIDRGAHVTVLTCTRGELGEIVDPELSGDLAVIRQAEIESAMRILGVADHRFLGATNARWEGAAPRRYLDSGMVWGVTGAEPVPDLAPGALTAAPFAEIAADIAMVIADVMPDAVISYNDAGGYGHPDHVLVGEATARAADVLAVPFYSIDADGPLSVDVTAVLDRKRAALRAYRSQLVVGATDFAGANGEREDITSVERFTRVVPSEPGVDNSYAAQTVGVQIFTLLVSVLFGAAAGIIVASAHQSTPFVAVLGLVVTAALVAGLRIVFSSRVVAGVASVALITGSAVMLTHMPITDALSFYLWAIGGPLVAVAAVAVPQRALSWAGKIGRLPAVKGSSIQ
jgi:N-acetyl-1-D-myo-inositol-2-amino-2-deoxy-alpha-D-glucopyranoside deacetylase